MAGHFYGQYCPLSKGAEAFAERWVPQILYELLCGARRFNELRRGIPRISPGLLSARLRHLEYYGLLRRRTRNRSVEYELTPAGKALQPVIESLAMWGKDHARTDVAMDELDANRLMWDIRRRARAPSGAGRTVVCFQLDPPGGQRRLYYWLVFDRGEVDLCLIDPGFETDLVVTGRLEALAAIWLGDVKLGHALRDGSLALQGPRLICRGFERWLGVSMVAELQRAPPG